MARKKKNLVVKNIVKLDKQKLNLAFCHRTKMLRESMGLTQEQMAERLGISAAVYQKNEIRTPLPHYMLTRFCDVTGLDMWYVVTGTAKRS